MIQSRRKQSQEHSYEHYKSAYLKQEQKLVANAQAKDFSQDLIISTVAAIPDKEVKGVEFPLDHILPQFNLSNKESKFVPTLKKKSKDNPLMKDRKVGLVKGSTVNQNQSK